MSDTALTKTEIAKIRGFCNRVGHQSAAKALDVHPQSLLGILSGAADPRPNTIKVLRAAIERGVLDSTPDLREHDAQGRAQATPAKVRA